MVEKTKERMSRSGATQRRGRGDMWMEEAVSKQIVETELGSILAQLSSAQTQKCT